MSLTLMDETYIEEASMSEGNLTIHKKIYFEVPEGDDPLSYNAIDVVSSADFPKRFDELPERNEYKFTGNASFEHLYGGKIFCANLEYSTNPTAGKDESGSYWNKTVADASGSAFSKDTAPWNLPPHVSVTTKEYSVPLTNAYNNPQSQGDKVDVVNSANDPLNASVPAFNVKVDITYNLQNFDYTIIGVVGNTVNETSTKVCGINIPQGKGILNVGSITKETVFEDNSDVIKWTYYKVTISIEIDYSDLVITRKFLDVGDRALFPYPDGPKYYTDAIITNANAVALPPSTTPERVCKIRKAVQIQITPGKNIYVPTGDIVYLGWSQFLIVRQALFAECNRLKINYDCQCEQIPKAPLDGAGHIDLAAMQGTVLYNQKIYYPYDAASWAGLQIPSEA